MEAIILRLARKFKVSLEDAGKLVEAGLDTPAKVKAAKREDLEKLIDKDKLDKVLKRFGKDKDK